MSKGYVWLCQNNNETDYTELSIELARTIKSHNKHNNICVIVDEKSIFQSKYVDEIKVLRTDDAQLHSKKFANEYKVFALTPFKHTIKLEADVIWNTCTDWWWNYLCKHDMVFSLDCLDYRQRVVKDTAYRPFHAQNYLPNIYNGMTYFRKSKFAQQFFDTCKIIVSNWKHVKEQVLQRCFDQYPTTDVVYALAYRLLDPTGSKLIDYPWFKWIHNKPAIHSPGYRHDTLNYYYPINVNGDILFGGKRITAPLHYYEKNFMEVMDVRTV